MRQSTLLAIASVLAALLLTLHLADDIVRGFEKGGLPNLLAIPIVVTWLYGALVLGERRSGYVIVLLGSLLGAFVPVIHFRVAGGVAGGGIASSSGAFFWVWSLIAIGVAGAFSAVLSAQGLWRLARSQPPKTDRNRLRATGA
ncbi:MAG TPA: hypothetical protein PK413_07870 [Thermoanaerobaculia bacterium]|nr:hypothetical protein [Thermoanaerobaculia bacterium]